MKIPRLLMSLALAAIVACDGDSGTTTSPPPPETQTLASISLATSTFALNAGQSTTLVPQALDASGAVISGVTGFSFTSSEPTIAEAQASGTVLAVGAGAAVVTVSVTRDGVTATALADFTVTGTLPSTVTVVAGNASNDFTPPSVAVALDAAVTFSFGARIHNVTHSATGAPANIPNTSNGNVIQNFPTAGDFPYDCTIHPGMQGTVIVR
ncbi:MAG: plastocyanin [Myxococcota bacterium]|jgi:plastocyanin